MEPRTISDPALRAVIAAAADGGIDAMAVFRKRIGGATPEEARKACVELLQPLQRQVQARDDLFFLNDIYRRYELFEAALSFLDKINKRGEISAPFYEKLGFTLLKLKRVEEALGIFTEGCTQFPEWAHNWLGVVVCSSLLHRSPDSYSDAVLRLFDFDVNHYGYGALVFDAGRTTANRLFERGERARLKTVYQALVKDAKATDLERVRLVEILTLRNEIKEAGKIVAQFAERAHRLDTHLRVVIASYYNQIGQHREALELFSFVWADRQPTAHALSSLISTLARAQWLDDYEEQLRVVIGRLPKVRQPAFLALLRTRRGDLAGAFELVASSPIKSFEESPYLVMELGYLLLERAEHDSTETCLGILKQLPIDKNAVYKLEANYLFQKQEWEKAETLLYQSGFDETALDDELALKRFELACFQRSFDKADALSARLVASLPEKPGFATPLMRYYAEIGRWKDVCALVTPRFLAQFKFAQTGDIIVKAFLRTGATEQLISLLAAEPRIPGSEVEHLKAVVTEQGALDIPSVEAALANPDMTRHAAIRDRLLAKRRLMQPSLAKDAAVRGNHVFLCADGPYVLPAAVCLSSLLRSCPGHSEGPVFHIVAEDLSEPGRRVFEKLSQWSGAEIRLHEPASIIDATDALSASYGVFTSGEQLSRAAYFRIYFAHYLSKIPGNRRGVYIDADTIVRGAIPQLLELSLDGAPLAARREVTRPEVIKAQTLHGLPPGSYFNSGVLLFDFESEQCRPGLERAIAAARSSQSQLLFHDQCALNIGFRGQVSYLDERFNYFVTRKLARDEIPGSEAVLHFLDRPKPWKSTYDGAGSTIWFEELHHLISVAGREVCLPLLLES